MIKHAPAADTPMVPIQPPKEILSRLQINSPTKPPAKPRSIFLIKPLLEFVRILAIHPETAPTKIEISKFIMHLRSISIS